MEKEIELTILIPALNEERTIEIVVSKSFEWLKKQKINGEVLVANNNSTDNTKQIAETNGARVIDVEEIGYGSALKEGIKQSKGKYIILGDADDSYNFLEIDNIYSELKNGNDLVIGNRFNKMEKGSMKWTHRYIGTPLISYLIRKKYKINIKDPNCGLRGIVKNKFEKMNLKANGMEFASEMIIKAAQGKLAIKEVPINFYRDKRNKKSHLNTVRDGYRHLKLIINNCI